MKTMEEKFRQIHKGCDNIVDEFFDGRLHSQYELGRYDLAKEIMDTIEEE